MKKLLVSAATAAGLLASTSAFAQAVPTVKLNVTLDVQDGCNLNGNGGSIPGGEVSLLNFGVVQNAPAIDSPVDGSTLAADGGTVITVNCNVDVPQVQLSVSEGDNDSGGVRRLANTSVAGEFVPYRLYAREGRTPADELLVNQSVTILGPTTAGTPITVVVYGRIAQSDINRAVAGPHTDTTGAQITF